MGEATSGFYSGLYSRGAPMHDWTICTSNHDLPDFASLIRASCDDAAVSGANYAPVELLVPSEIGDRSSSAENKSSLA